MATILIIDDDPSLLDMLALSIEDAGHEVLTARDGDRGWQRIQAADPDLVVSDVNMPGLDGFSLCRKVREAGLELPVILLTARDSEIDEALGLELGADDYVIKPFRSRVLMARISALLRRQQLTKDNVVTPDDERLERDGLALDKDRLEAVFCGTKVVTTVTEFRLLCTLIQRPGIVFTREQLLERIRGDDSIVAERLIDTYVRRLRRKFETIKPSFEGIETVIGAGYRWRDCAG